MEIEVDILKMNRILLTIIFMVLGGLFTLSAQARELSDPTRPGGTVSSRGGYSGLRSIKISARSRVAVIDGRKYRVGDKYKGSIIKRIEQYSVLMSKKGKTTRMRLVPRVKSHKGGQR